MAISKKPVRVARRVKSLAQTTKRFYEVSDRLARSQDPEEQKRLKQELARLTFGE